MAYITTDTLSAPVQQSFDAKILSTPTANQIHNLAAMPKRMPSKGGKILRMRRYNQLQPALVPLGSSGLTPPPQMATAVDIDAEISFYGTYLQINEQCTLQAQDKPLNELAIRLGVSLRITEDLLTRNMLQATASQINCTGGVNGDLPTEITASDIGNVIKTLLTNDAKTILENVEAEDKFGTGPIRNSFMAFCHTDLTEDINNVAKFKHVNEYPSQHNIGKAEWGSVQNLRFWISSQGAKVANSSFLGSTVYSIFVTGMESYAYVLQDGMSATFIYRPAIFDSALALNASVGYKFGACPKILNDLWLFRLNATLA